MAPFARFILLLGKMWDALLLALAALAFLFPVDEKVTQKSWEIETR